MKPFTQYVAAFVAIMVMCLVTDRSLAQVRGVEDAIELLEAATQSVKSFDCRITVTRSMFIVIDTVPTTERTSKGKAQPPKVANIRKVGSNESPKVSREFFRQVHQNEKGRIEFFNSDNSKVLTHIVYDRESEKSWTPKDSSGEVRELGITLTDGWDYLSLIKYSFGRAELVRCLRERSNVKLKVVEPNGSITLETTPDMKNEGAFPRWGFRVTLDSKHGFMPAMIELFIDKNGSPFTESRKTINEWRSLGNGTWVPVKATTQHFSASDRFYGEVQSDMVMEVDVANSSWNRVLPDSTFQITFPAGTRVVDTRRQLMYVTGKPDATQNLDTFAESAREVVPLVYNFPPANEPWKKWLALAEIAMLLIVGAALFIAYRKRWNSSKRQLG